MKIEGIELTFDEAKDLLFSADKISELERERNELLNSIAKLTDENARLSEENRKLMEMLDTMTAPGQQSDGEERWSLSDIAHAYHVTNISAYQYMQRHGMPEFVVVNNTKLYRRSEIEKLFSKRRAYNYDGDYINWVKPFNEKLREAKVNKKLVWNSVYQKLNRIYGIVWMQLAKEYGTNDKTRLCYFLDTKHPHCNRLVTNMFNETLSEMKGA